MSQPSLFEKVAMPRRMLPTGQNNQAEQAQKEADDLPEFSLAVWAKRGLYRISIQSPSVPPSAVLLAKLARGGG
jgi:hypothetical protein